MLEPIIRSTRQPEPRDSNNIPIGCPLDRVEMLRYAMGQLDEEEFDPCRDCEFFKVRRGDATGDGPRRNAGAWFDYGYCTAPERPAPTLVAVHEVDARARKVVADDPETTNNMVLNCIDHDHRLVRQIVGCTDLAERTVFKVIRRLRQQGVVAENAPLRRFGETVNRAPTRLAVVR